MVFLSAIFSPNLGVRVNFVCPVNGLSLSMVIIRSAQWEKHYIISLSSGQNSLIKT